MYGLVLNGTRVSTAGIYQKKIPDGVIAVESLPEGDITQYDYENGKFVLNPDYVDELTAQEQARIDAESKPSILQEVADLKTELNELKSKVEKTEEAGKVKA